ncbi:MAG TPA: hypothetical protein VMU11_00470 [Verrucomicrobiae bacterium]|nr:hypothetical protein [Verrucomicrobiae bacterium]
MAWRTYSGRVDGLPLKGDPEMPPTTWWNAWFLRAFVWKQATILMVPPEVKEYRVGFIPGNGIAEYNTNIIRAPRFAVKHGREDCRFFAVMLDGTELPLKIACRMEVLFLPNSVPEL